MLREDSRSVILAESSEGDAMWFAVTTHCSISAFSAVEYYSTVRIRPKPFYGKLHTSALSKMAEETLTGSLSKSFACEYDFVIKLLTPASNVAMVVEVPLCCIGLV